MGATAVVVAASVLLGPVQSPQPEAASEAGAPAVAEPEHADPEQLIAEAEAALVDGEPTVAADQFTAAYGGLDREQRFSDLGALIITEAVKARLAAWRATMDLKHLLRARSLLHNHIIGVEAEGDDAKPFFEEMVRIDGLISRAREAEPTPEPPPPQPERARTADAPPPPVQRDPAQRRRFVAGMSVLGAGAALFVVGLGFTAHFLTARREFAESLRRDQVVLANDCTTEADQATEDCRQLEANIDTWSRSGRRASTLGLTTGIVAGVGLVAMVVGLGVGLTTPASARRRVSATPGGLTLSF